MDKNKLMAEWMKWKRESPKQYDKFRKEFSIKPKEEDEETECDFYESNPSMCQICMIESCHVNSKYASDRWSGTI
jgi:hypothetical protein